MTNKKLWGETLYKVFKYHLIEDGWLTINWGHIVEELENKKDIYRLMYLQDLVFSDCEQFVKPENTQKQILIDMMQSDEKDGLYN